MEQIRKNVFETNSSSSHSLTISHVEDPRQLSYSAGQIIDGKLYIQLKEYGWEWFRYYALVNKLSYIFTDMLPHSYGEGCTENLMQLAKDNAFGKRIIKMVEETLGCSVEIIGSKNQYIDHESVGTSGELSLLDDEALYNFLFFTESYIETGNDNSELPEFIQTDIKGLEDTFEAHRLDVDDEEYTNIWFSLAYDEIASELADEHRYTLASRNYLGDLSYYIGENMVNKIREEGAVFFISKGCRDRYMLNAILEDKHATMREITDAGLKVARFVEVSGYSLKQGDNLHYLIGCKIPRDMEWKIRDEITQYLINNSPTGEKPSHTDKFKMEEAIGL